LILAELLLSEMGPFATGRLKVVARLVLSLIPDFNPVSGSLEPD
jgi:hypothetical protein